MVWFDQFNGSRYTTSRKPFHSGTMTAKQFWFKSMYFFSRNMSTTQETRKCGWVILIRTLINLPEFFSKTLCQLHCWLNGWWETLNCYQRDAALGTYSIKLTAYPETLIRPTWRQQQQWKKKLTNTRSLKNEQK